jgi:pimeloyl-ACP methyl ester carboxylesterase
MKNIYFISGVGADKRLFSFLDLSFCHPVFIDWIPPLKNESLQQYALRLKELIPEDNPVIIGVSFGGMLAIEIAKVNPNAKTIIISSNKTSKEFPWYLRLGKYFPVYKLIPKYIREEGFRFYQFFFGADKSRKILEAMLKDTNHSFINWAISAILNWDNQIIPGNVIHIHGTKDKLLPYRFVKADYTIQNGGHAMVLDKASEITAVLKKLL